MVYANLQEAIAAQGEFEGLQAKLGISCGSDDPFCGVEFWVRYYDEAGEIKMHCWV